MLIPFGAVISVSKTGAHTTLNIYTTKNSIEKLHPALVGLGTVITTNDDLPMPSIYKSTGAPAVIANETVTVHKTHKAYMVEKAAKKAPKKPVPSPDFKKPLRPGWYYWLEPK
jgi:hypothetical protein